MVGLEEGRSSGGYGVGLDGIEGTADGGAQTGRIGGGESSVGGEEGGGKGLEIFHVRAADDGFSGENGFAGVYLYEAQS